ncbi:MAG: NAD(P)/FAD-dependent oxidoreductase [Pseudomonadota bacterium]
MKSPPQPGGALNTKSAQAGGNSPRIAVIGAGLSGLCMGIFLKQAGFEDVTLYEKASEVGGTWRENTYPGVACDVPSQVYSFSFALNPNWSKTFADGDEIWAYTKRVVEEFDLARHIRFNTEIETLAYDDTGWTLRTTTGERIHADFVIAGMGGLHTPNIPDIPGLEDFAGTTFHSAEWNHAHDLTGRRIGLIGSAASAVQILPRIQPQAGHVTLFQRTANWILPRGDTPNAAWVKSAFKTVPGLQRLVRGGLYLNLESRFPAFKKGHPMRKMARRWLDTHLEKSVKDPALRAALTPDYPPGCKRILLSDDFYPALQQPNVTLETTPIAAIEPEGIRMANGTRHAVDTLILATGFHPFGLEPPFAIHGRDGQSIFEMWADGVSAHRSVAVAGFPNLFFLMGPNSGLGHNSVIVMIEAQARYILQCIQAVKAQGAQSIEVRSEASDRFNEDVQASLSDTIWDSGCKSWYKDEKGRNYTLWPHSTLRFRREMRSPDLAEYTIA